MPARHPYPPGLGPSGRRLWREYAGRTEFGPGDLVLLREACRTADSLDFLDALAVDTELSDAERRRALAEARGQRGVLVRLVTALRPGPGAAKPVVSNRLAQLRAIHGKRPS